MGYHDNRNHNDVKRSSVRQREDTIRSSSDGKRGFVTGGPVVGPPRTFVSYLSGEGRKRGGTSEMVGSLVTGRILSGRC